MPRGAVAKLLRSTSHLPVRPASSAPRSGTDARGAKSSRAWACRRYRGFPRTHNRKARSLVLSAPHRLVAVASSSCLGEDISRTEGQRSREEANRLASSVMIATARQSKDVVAKLAVSTWRGPQLCTTHRLPLTFTTHFLLPAPHSVLLVVSHYLPLPRWCGCECSVRPGVNTNTRKRASQTRTTRN